MIAVTFRADDGREYTTSVPKRIALRDLQRWLCATFGARFPAMQANLEVAGRLHDDFDDVPFADCDRPCDRAGPLREPRAACTCGEKAEALVSFAPNTTNPFWFDWADRREPKCTLEEEVAYEDATRMGETSLSLRAWLRERRAAEPGR